MTPAQSTADAEPSGPIRTNIVLIGPRGNGKTTLAGLLSAQLRVRHAIFDAERWDFYAEIGYDASIADRFLAQGDLHGVFDYWGPFETHAVERFLNEHQHAVLDLGCGHTVFGTEKLFQRVEKALSPFPNVVLLLPSTQLAESMRVLAGRADDPDMRRPYISAWLEDTRRHQLAKLTIYQENRSPQELVDEIICALLAG